MSADHDDPLDGADIGETATVSETTDIWVGGLEGDATEGTDRLVDSEIVGTEVVTDEYGDQHLRVTVESDVTKRLPRRWDERDAPRTDAERKRALRSRVADAVGTLVPMGVALGIGLAVTHRVMSGLAGEVVINGEGLTYTVWDLVPVVGLMLLLVAVVFALPRLPAPPSGGGGR